MKILGMNFGHSMDNLWLGTEWSMLAYMKARDAFLADPRFREKMLAFNGEDAAVDAPSAKDIGDYLIEVDGDTAHVSLRGAMVQDYCFMHPQLEGSVVSYQAIRAAMAKLQKMDSVRHVILDVNSPGGHAMGIMEASRSIERLNKVKPVTANVHGTADSAAYWLVSSAGKINVTPMSEVGSIGVIALYEDRSAEAKMEGVKYLPIHAGKYKATGFSGTPITEADQAYLQGKVDKIYGMFLKQVATHRPVNASEIGRWADAQTFYGEDAVKVGLADQLVESFEDLEEAAKLTNTQAAFASALQNQMIGLVNAGVLSKEFANADIVQPLLHNQAPYVITDKNVSALANNQTSVIMRGSVNPNPEVEADIVKPKQTEIKTPKVDPGAGPITVEDEAAKAALIASGVDESQIEMGETVGKVATTVEAPEVQSDSVSVAELAIRLGRAEAAMESLTANVAASEKKIEEYQTCIHDLKSVAQSAVAKLQIALQAPRETKDSPADIVAQYNSLTKLLSDRYPTSRKSDAVNDTKELDLTSKVTMAPDPYRPTA